MLKDLKGRESYRSRRILFPPLTHLSMLSGRTFTLFSLVSFAFAVPQLHKRAFGVTNDASSANGQEFDYIIIGGGLGGTTVAGRLSENPAISVLLVEAGADNRGDPRVYDIYAYSQAFGTELDWAWETDQGRVMRG